MTTSPAPRTLAYATASDVARATLEARYKAAEPVNTEIDLTNAEKKETTAATKWHFTFLIAHHSLGPRIAPLIRGNIEVQGCKETGSIVIITTERP